MWAASLIIGLASGLMSRAQHMQNARELYDMKIDVPQSAYESLDIYKDMANTGLPGYESILSNIRGQLPESISQVKEFASNPSQVLGALSESNEEVLSQLRSVDIQDAIAKTQNQQALAGAMMDFGRFEVGLDEINKGYDIAAIQEKSAGTAALLQGVMQGLSGAVSAYGSKQKADAFKTMGDRINFGEERIDVDTNIGGYSYDYYNSDEYLSYINNNPWKDYSIKLLE